MNAAALYDAIAEVYDLSGQSRFSLRMVSYLLEILALRRARPRRVVDLACGTGAAAVALARRGFEVTGVDGSEAMLARARTRAARWKANVRFECQGLADLDIPACYDLGTCFYDSINHLIEPDDVRKLFFAVRRALVPGGLFFFDVNTPYALAEVWGNATDCHLAEAYARFWRASYDAASGLATLDATYFLRREGHYERLAATHVARGYTPDGITGWLREAGLTPIATYACFSFEPADARTYRVAYLAQA
ncbi:MAG TPA: methyltransferase domain-containing protein [Oscillatoriaceae cyanobacterium]